MEIHLFYMTNSDDCPPKPNDEVTLADVELALELLADLDLSDADPDATVAAHVADGPALKAVMAKQEERRRKPERSAKPSAVAERHDYRINKAAAGKGPVRPYSRSDIEPRRLREGDFETEEEYNRRYKREWARNKRGVTAEGIEEREFVREVTTADEKRKKRALAEKNRRAAMTREQKNAEAARKKRRRDEIAGKGKGDQSAT